MGFLSSIQNLVQSVVECFYSYTISHEICTWSGYAFCCYIFSFRASMWCIYTYSYWQKYRELNLVNSLGLGDAIWRQRSVNTGWRHRVITWINVQSSVWLRDIRMRAISPSMLKCIFLIWAWKYFLKITAVSCRYQWVYKSTVTKP